MGKIQRDQLSPFLSYLQKRMDFIAQVATSPPSWCLLTGFDTLVGGFTRQHCLINNIIRSHQGEKSGPDFEPLLEHRYSTETEQVAQLDIPHGEIGAQAFYTILENIVRNTAKYGDPVQLAKIKDKTGDGKLKFTITVDEKWAGDKKQWTQNYYRIRIMDHLENKSADGSPNQEVVDRLNANLSDFLTDRITQVVKPKNWGMKEIKICAAYLRMVKQEDIDDEFQRWANGINDSEPPMIEVSLEKLDGSSDDPAVHLTYTLYLMRPKQALVVTDDELVKDDQGDMQKQLRRVGVDFYKPDEFREAVKKDHRLRHTFVVLPKPQSEQKWAWLLNNSSFLPPRILIRDCTEADIPSVMPELARTLAFTPARLPVHPALLIDMLWTNWVNRWWGNYRILIRERYHAKTIAEVGYQEDWDQPDELPSGDWLVFDHKKQQDKTRLFQDAAYHQGFGHDSPTAELLKKASRELIRDSTQRTDEQADNYSRLRIKESAGLSVAVIDERVWLEKDGLAQEGVRHYASTTSRFDVWRKRRVFLQDTNRVLDNFKDFVEKLDPPDIRVFDFIIIHQGIIDTIREKEAGNFEDTWRMLKNRARWVIIDSGRGQPEQAGKDNLRWVEYSNLAECLVQYAGDKFRLAELLWTLRASGKLGGPT